ncbi:RING finger protein [Endozoicomonas sp. 8E]|uniref:RING finger protein n=1 Tax=Endozoicomonas sp. 8E TaxID=3035692 RepID=UPI0029390BB6|nr:RING finger protein [Endozoicomonas sp. 8E]WOG28190.1 RING finger protein [Endozoicomonas sp. 8E]
MNGITPPGSPNNQSPYQQETDQCPICLELFDGREVTVLDPCNHMFHENCLETWLRQNTTCPYCRTIVRERAVEPFPDVIVERISRRGGSAGGSATFYPDGRLIPWHR